MHQLPAASERDGAAPTVPAGGGVALIGAAMMIAGAFGPWIGGTFFGVTNGIDLGGDGWLVLAAATLALLPVVLPLPRSALTGVWVIALALVAAFVCWSHYSDARVDGTDVVWGLELAGIGSGLLGFAGLRILLDRS